MIIRQTSLIEVRKSRSKGRGIFATAFIPEGTVFEQAPVLVMPSKEVNGDANSKELVWFDVIESDSTVAPKSAKTKAVPVPQKASRTKPDTAATKSRKPTPVATKRTSKKSSKSEA